MLAPDHCGRANADRAPHHGAEVLRVLDSIEGNGDQVGVCEQLAELVQREGRCKRERTLMLDTPRQLIEPTTVHALDRADTLITREALERCHLWAAIRGYQQLEDLTAPRSHALAYRLQAEHHPLIRGDLRRWWALGISTALIGRGGIAPCTVAATAIAAGWLSPRTLGTGRVTSRTIATGRLAPRPVAAARVTPSTG